MNQQDIENEFAEGAADLRKSDYPLFGMWSVENFRKAMFTRRNG